MKRVLGLVLVTGLLATLGGCVYPAYQRPSVVYDDGTVVGGDSVGEDRYDYAYSDGYVPSYYAGGYYDPWYYGYGPFIGLGFYGSYRFGYHHGYYGGHGSYHGSHGPSHGGSNGSHHGH